MKARDLAALAALGIAGKMAYDKFGKKDEPKKKMGEGLEMSNQGAYERATIPKSAAADVEMGTKGAYLPETAELRTKGAYLDDTPEFRTKGAYLDERATPAVEAKPVAKPVAKAAVSRSVAAAPAAAPAAAAAPIASTVQDSAQMPDATRVKAYNPDSMYNTTIPFDPQTRDRENRVLDGATTLSATDAQAYARMQRQGSVAPLTMNESAKARMQRQGTKPAQTPNAQAQARLLRQGAGRAKGGAVKMASGGMTSSKMSKPSGASRGDGIAQRGRTRGTLR